MNFPTQRIFIDVHPKQSKVVFILELMHLYLRCLKKTPLCKRLKIDKKYFRYCLAILIFKSK